MKPIAQSIPRNVNLWMMICLLSLGLPFPAQAILLTGPFVDAQASAAGVATNGAEFSINFINYPVPAELQPTNEFTFKLSPQRGLLFARTATSTPQCAGAEISFYQINVPTRNLTLVQGPTCIPEGIAFDRFYDLPPPGPSPQKIAAIGEIAPSTAIRQRIRWVDLDNQPSSVWAEYDKSIESIRFGPSGTVALVKHAVSASPSGPLATYSVVDLCPGSLGTRLGRLTGLTATASAAVVLNGSTYAARIFDDNLTGGSTDLPLADCVGGAVPPNTSLVTIEVAGPGRVTAGNFIDCPGTCSAFINENANAVLRAIPASGASFVGWSGDCSTADLNISVPVGTGLACTATFDGATAAVSLQANVLPDDIVAGVPLTVAVTLTNNGPDDSGRIDLNFTLPRGDEPIQGLIPCGLSIPSGRGCVLLAGIPAGQSQILEFQITPDPLWRGGFPLAISAVLRGNVFDPDGGDNDALLAPIVSSAVDVSINIQTDSSVEAQGEPVNAVVDIVNNGPSAATGIVVDVNLPQDWVRTDGQTERNFSCIAPTLYPGNNWKLFLRGEIAGGSTPGTNASLIASYTGRETDLDSSNDGDSAVIQVITTPVQAAAGTFATMLIDELFLGLRGEPSQFGETTSYHSSDSSSGNEGLVIYTGENALNLVNSFTRTPGGNARFVGGPEAARNITSHGVGTFFAFATNAPGGGAYDLADGGVGNLHQTRTCGIERVFTEADQAATPSLDLAGVSLPIFRPEGVAYRPAGPNATGQSRAGLQIYDGTGFISLVEPTDPVPGGAGEFYVTDFHWNGNSVALTAGIIDGGLLNNGIYFHDLVTLSKVIDNTDLLPDRPATVNAFLRISSNTNQAAMFIRGSDARWGLYRYDHPSALLNLMLDDATVLPDGQGGTTTLRNLTAVSDESGPAVDGQDIAIAVNTEATNGGGKTLYLFADGDYRRILGPGDALAGRTVADVAISPYAMDEGRIAMIVTFTNFTGGVFVYTLAANPDNDPNIIFVNGFE